MDSSSLLKKLVADQIVVENWDLSDFPKHTYFSIHYALAEFVPVFTSLLDGNDRSAWSIEFTEFMKCPFGNENSGLQRCQRIAENLRVEIESGSRARCLIAVNCLKAEYEAAMTRIHEYTLARRAEGTLSAEPRILEMSQRQSPADTAGSSRSCTEPLAEPSHAGDEDQESNSDVSAKVSESSVCAVTVPTHTPNSKSKKKGKGSQATSPAPSVLNSTDSTNEIPEAWSSQLLALQEPLNQVIAMQKEAAKQMSVLVSVAVTKEGRRVETAIGRGVEKITKANNDALWARIQDDKTKTEKLSQDRTQQIANSVSNLINKDLPAILEKTTKKELAAVGPAVARTITPIIEKTVSSVISESFQRGVGDKAVHLLDKSVNTKIEATVARQIQAQFQTSGRQALQDGLKSNFETMVIPAFEMSCKAMFEQVDATFQKGIAEHTGASQQQFNSSHSPLALTLREALNTASSVTQTLSAELADGQRKLIALAAAGANASGVNPLVAEQLSNGPLGVLHEKVEAPLDPMKELSRLVSECKYEEAFTSALQRSDVNIVSWLCSQVDLPGILSTVPLALSHGVLLSLLQQLSCDINRETSRKLGWMAEVAAAINPADAMIAMHVRPVFEQVYQILNHQRSVPTMTGPDQTSVKLLMLLINSVIKTCK